MALGIILALVGLSIMSGFIQSLINWPANLFIFSGIAAVVVGGAPMIFGDLVGRVIGVALLTTGIAVAVMGVVMKVGPLLWFVHWLIWSGGTVMLVIGIIMAVIGLLGVVKGSGRRRYIKYGRGKYIYY